MSRNLTVGVPLLLAVGLSVAASAAEKSGKTPDPGEKICEKIDIIGSRIASKRICATRAEWAERRRQDREVIDRAQMSPCVLTHSVVGANGNGHQAC